MWANSRITRGIKGSGADGRWRFNITWGREQFSSKSPFARLCLQWEQEHNKSWKETNKRTRIRRERRIVAKWSKLDGYEWRVLFPVEWLCEHLYCGWRGEERKGAKRRTRRFITLCYCCLLLLCCSGRWSVIDDVYFVGWLASVCLSSSQEVIYSCRRSKEVFYSTVDVDAGNYVVSCRFCCFIVACFGHLSTTSLLALDWPRDGWMRCDTIRYSESSWAGLRVTTGTKSIKVIRSQSVERGSGNSSDRKSADRPTRHLDGVIATSFNRLTCALSDNDNIGNVYNHICLKMQQLNGAISIATTFRRKMSRMRRPFV